MADFGAALANCPGAELEPSVRLLASPGCVSVYEEWNSAFDVGGVFSRRPGFAIDTAITQFDSADPERLVFNRRFACGDADPGGCDSYC